MGAIGLNESKRKTCLVISTRKFWPPDSGHKVVLYNYCKKLYEELGYCIIVYSFLESGQDDSGNNRPEFVSEVFYSSRISTLRKCLGIVKGLVNPHIPMQSFAFVDNENLQRIQFLIDKHKPSVVFFDMVRLAPYVAEIKTDAKIVLDLDDLLSLRYKRQLESSEAKANILGKLGESSSLLRQLTNNSLIRKGVLTLESRRVAAAESFFGELSDIVVFVSSKEASLYNSGARKRNAINAPMGVDFDYFSRQVPFERRENTISFFGDLKTAANQDTLYWIVDNILPKLNGVELLVVGDCPESLRLQLKNNKEIIFTGRVDDVRPFIRATTVFVAPIVYGTGIKTKILEAMAIGVPVVTNSVGIEGLNVVDGVHCFVCETPEQQVNAIRKLMEAPLIAKSISENARSYVKENHQWSSCAAAFTAAGL